MQALIGNWTFLEAYERTGRVLNVTVSPADTNEPPRLLNYLTTPQVGRGPNGGGFMAFGFRWRLYWRRKVATASPLPHRRCRVI